MLCTSTAPVTGPRFRKRDLPNRRPPCRMPSPSAVANARANAKAAGNLPQIVGDSYPRYSRIV